MGERDPPSVDDLLGSVEREAYEEATVVLDRYESARAEERKAAIRSLRGLADDRPAALSPLLPSIAPFLTDEDRSVRLTTARLIVAVAEAEPGAVVPVVPALAARLADEDEFYYVRARSAEALGYTALEEPGAVASPETLADFRVGLSFDEPEVKEKLAKALEFVSLGDPGRLRHQVPTLAAHLDDEAELVRYHLCTALVAVGSAHPTALADARTELRRLLDDEEAFVRGRAAEALGLLARADVEGPSVEALAALEGDEPFVAERARFAASAGDVGDAEAVPDDVGTVEGIRRTTEAVVEEITSPDVDGECPHCGVALPEHGPPMCPRCGAPY